ncbi:MAG: hypothetical protein AB1349_11575 [Elusimicrobiota bacterium]
MKMKNEKLKIKNYGLVLLVILYFTFYIFNCLFSGCGFIFGKKTTGKITTINENLNPDRLTDLAVVKKLAGYKRFLFVSNAQYTDWVEGFLMGVIVDENDSPMPNIQVMVDGIGFENAVTDVNGVYKIRFSIPIVKGIADANGKLIIHPKWETELEIKGFSYQPAIKDAPFRIYYNGNAGGVVALNEGKLPPRIIVKKISLGQYKTETLRKETIEKKTTEKPIGRTEQKPAKKETGFDDLFKQLEDFNK